VLEAKSTSGNVAWRVPLNQYFGAGKALATRSLRDGRARLNFADGTYVEFDARSGKLLGEGHGTEHQLPAMLTVSSNDNMVFDLNTRTSKPGKRRPAVGYRFADEKNGDLRVQWAAGTQDPDHQ